MSAQCICLRACQGGLVTACHCRVCSAHVAECHRCHQHALACRPVTTVSQQPVSPWWPHRSHHPGVPRPHHPRIATDLQTLVSPQTCSPCPHRPCHPGVSGGPITSVSWQTLSPRCPMSPQTPSLWCPRSPHHFGGPCHPSVPTNPITLMSPGTIPESLWTFLPQCPCRPWCPQRCRRPTTQCPAIQGCAVAPPSPSPSPPAWGSA